MNVHKEKSHKADFAKGGSTKMFGKQHAGEQAPGGTATKSGSDGKFATGGKTKMFGYNPSCAAKAGQTGAC